MKQSSVMTLRKWIDDYGIHKLAKTLKVNSSSVWNWKRGYCLPTVNKMQKIVALSHGTLSFDKITKDYYATANKKNRWNKK